MRVITASLRSKRFLASSSRKLGREQKKKERTGEGEGHFFFCSCCNFRVVTRLETLATQARSLLMLCRLFKIVLASAFQRC